MTTNSKKLLIIIVTSSVTLAFIFNSLFGTTFRSNSMFESIIHDSLNHILRAIGAFLILEPILLLWKKYIDKKEIPKWFSKQFIEEEIQTFFVFWLLTTLIHLPGYPIWIWFN